MQRNEKGRHIKSSAGDFNGPGNFAVFKSVEVTGINKVPGSFTSDPPIGRHDRVGIQIGKIGGQLSVQWASDSDLSGHLDFAAAGGSCFRVPDGNRVLTD